MNEMSKLTIDKGVPLPPPNSGPGPLTRAMRAMAVGDSIFLPDKTQAQVSGHVSAVRQKGNAHLCFAIRNVEGGVRIWRIADRKMP